MSVRSAVDFREIPTGNETLAEVLTNGNNAGSQSIIGVNDMSLNTINGSAYPPVGLEYIPLTLTPTPANPVSGTAYTLYNSVLPAGTYLVSAGIRVQAQTSLDILTNANFSILTGVSPSFSTIFINQLLSSVVSGGSTNTTITLTIPNVPFVSNGTNPLVIGVNADGSTSQVFYFNQYANLLKVA
nr:MAG: hypothetical protein [Lake Baikal virophage 8]